MSNTIAPKQYLYEDGVNGLVAPNHPVYPHVWEEQYGFVDCFAGVGEGYHNGPRCVKCTLRFCEHCHPKKWSTPCPKAMARG